MPRKVFQLQKKLKKSTRNRDVSWAWPNCKNLFSPLSEIECKSEWLHTGSYNFVTKCFHVHWELRVSLVYLWSHMFSVLTFWPSLSTRSCGVMMCYFLLYRKEWPHGLGAQCILGTRPLMSLRFRKNRLSEPKSQDQAQPLIWCQIVSVLSTGNIPSGPRSVFSFASCLVHDTYS